MEKVAVFWFRRDLRLDDNAGLYHALKSGIPIVPIFIFDTNILDRLEDRSDARLTFIHQSLQQLNEKLRPFNCSLHTFHGEPVTVWQQILKLYAVEAVFTNHDYEPYASERDQTIKELLEEKGIDFSTFKDQVVFEKSEVLKDNGQPYTVFTPYSRKWKARLTPFYLSSYPTLKYAGNFAAVSERLHSLDEMGFEPSSLPMPQKDVSKAIIANYHTNRNFPGKRSTSRLGTHLRFGLISIRKLAVYAQRTNETFLNELIWRDFYQMILHHFPHVTQSAFKPKYDRIAWRNDPDAFEAEIDAHLDEHERDKGNKRNGRKQKTVCTSDGNVEIEMPQDCQSSFETKVIRKRETILADSLQDRIIGLYGPGMSYRFISSHIHEMYDMEISHTVLIEATGTGRKVGRKIPGVHQFMT